MKLAARVRRIAPSATLALAARAAELKAAGRDVVSLAAGEPDFAPPPVAIEAMKAALDSGETRYTAVRGIPPLVRAVCDDQAARGAPCASDAVIVTSGAKQALFNALQALVEPGDEVVIVAPYWLSYPEMVRVAGGEPVFVEATAADAWVPRPEALAAALTPRTRAVLLNSPCNPTGAVIEADALRALLAVVEPWPDVVVVSDEIYSRFRYDGARPVCAAAACPALQDRILVVNGASKRFAMTGLRVGWAAGPPALIAAMAKLQGQSTSHASAAAQHGAAAALRGAAAWEAHMAQTFAARRTFALARLAEIPGLRCPAPAGAFYLFPDLSAFAGRALPGGGGVQDASDLADFLLRAHEVMVAPGAPFGAKHCVRLSFSVDLDTLGRALDRLGEGLARL
ncbi:MAG: pyridoxal phosphate-dependent aminotransferase [Alphaproteobacteria bacterium]|nr:pyridoxal phosphate-dependent aminotransferase [Alphaproteobacteria bacterium]